MRKGGILEKRRSHLLSSRKAICVVCAVLGLCLVTALAVQGTLLASASGNKFDSGRQDCSVTVKMPNPKDPLFSAVYGDMPAIPEGLKYDLYKVASATQSTKGDDSYTFTATDSFASLATGLDELASMNSLSSNAAADYGSKYSDLAKEAAVVVRGGTMKPVSSKTVDEQASDLTCGLYLVLVHGATPKDYFAESKDGIITVANSDSYKFMFLPQLIALPSKKPVLSENEINGGSTADKADWQYSIEAILKPSWEPLYGSLDIVKTLRTFDNGKAATFVFDIEGRDSSNKVIYSNTASLVFNGATSQVAHIDQIPAGLEVTVTEVYSGASYKLTSQPEQNATIVADDAVSVEFENDYNGSGNSGGSVTNSFSYQQGEDGNGQWTWSKDGEEQR